MGKTSAPAKKRKRRRRVNRRKQQQFLLLAGSLALVCVLVAAILLLESALPGPEPVTEPAPTEPTLPPNPFSVDDFAYVNGYLSCTAGEYTLGIDVSEHQQQIDWTQVADAGMEFAFVRIGYRGYTRGDIHTDEYADQNIRQAKAAGMQVGAYFYSQAVNEEEAAQEAAFCVDFLKDYELDLPVVFDWEYVSQEARTGDMDAETLTQCARVFCEAVEQAGYEAMVYSNPDLARSLLQLTELTDYRFWLALYADTMSYPYQADFWQYTNTGSVSGIEGDVDINLMFTYG